MTEVVAAGEWLERARTLKAEGWWLASLCGLDLYRAEPDRRFEVVVHLLNRERKQWLRLHVAAEGDPPSVPSVAELYPGADFMEREAYDMFGIHFDGHPNLTRILMPDDWEGHPLRKDYGVGKVPIEYIPQPYLQIDSPGQEPDAFDAGREVDRLGQAGAPQRRFAGAPGKVPHTAEGSVPAPEEGESQIDTRRSRGAVTAPGGRRTKEPE